MLTEKKQRRHERAAALPANSHADPPQKGAAMAGAAVLPANSLANPRDKMAALGGLRSMQHRGGDPL